MAIQRMSTRLLLVSAISMGLVLSGTASAIDPVYFQVMKAQTDNVTNASYGFELAIEIGNKPAQDRYRQLDNWVSTGWDSSLAPGEIMIDDVIADHLGEGILASAEAKSNVKPHAWVYDGVGELHGNTAGIYSRADCSIFAQSNWFGVTMPARSLAGNAGEATMTYQMKTNIPGQVPGPQEVYSLANVSLSLGVSWNGPKTYGDHASVDVELPGLVGTVACDCIRYPSSQVIDFVVHVNVEYNETLPDGLVVHRSVQETRFGESSYSRRWGGTTSSVTPDANSLDHRVFAHSKGDIDVYNVAGTQTSPVHMKSSQPKATVNVRPPGTFNYWTNQGNGAPQVP